MADNNEQDTTEDGAVDALTALIMGETAKGGEADDDEEDTGADDGSGDQDDGEEDGADDESQDTDDDESDDEDSDDDESDEDDDEDDGKPAPKVVPDDAVVFTLDDEGKSIPVTAGEAKAGYLRQADYSRKTAERAEQMKALQAERTELQTALAGVLKVLDAEDADSTPEKLAELARTDPEKAMQLRLEREARAEQRKRVQAASDELAKRTEKENQEAAEAARAEEFSKLLVVMPDLKDPAKAPTLLANMTEAAKAAGFEAEDMNRVTDHRLMRLLALAYEGLRLTKKPKPKPRPKGEQVPTLRPGVKKPKGGNKAQADREARFQQTRTVDDAADSLLGLMQQQKRTK